MALGLAYPAIPHPTTDPASLRDAVIALKQAFEIHSGQKGVAGVAAVTADTLAANNNTTNNAISAVGAASTAGIAALAASSVSSIAGNFGAFTLNAASGITNATNDIKLSQASASQFGAVKVDAVTIAANAGVISAALTVFKSSLGADVALNNTANYFDGPSVAQGTVGTWFVSGTVTVLDPLNAPVQINCKLWDGTTVIASAAIRTGTALVGYPVPLSGVITSPAGNLRISCNAPQFANAKILFNASGNSKDSTITAVRIG